ncbi:MAG: PD40 domain-containing protein [Candidatus Marinimicrobia bacterium]|nr:PD40 domain-containing protein [Candidatus Neomarinimicrobiota bacterium]
MCEEKRGKIFLIPARPILFIIIVAGGKAGNAVNSGTIDKFSNEKEEDFALFNLCKGFCKALYNILLLVIALFITSCNDEGNMIIDIDPIIQVVDLFPKWSPVSNKIVYAHSSSNFNDYFPRGIYIIDTLDKKMDLLLSNGKTPSWSPDGNSIVFEREGDIYTYDLNTSDILRLTYNAHSFFPSWSPDGQFIVYDISVNRPNDTTGINIINMQTNKRKWFTGGLMASWSPDGNYLVYSKGVSFTPGYSNAEIFKCDSNGKNEIQLTKNGKQGPSTNVIHNFFPAWSPDGKNIAFQHDYEIWAMDSDGNDPYKVIDGEKPGWSPTGEWIVFSYFINEQRLLYMVKPDGSDLTMITNEELYDQTD